MRLVLPAAALATVLLAAFSAQAQQPAAANKLPVFRLCTGAPDANYQYAGSQIREQAKGQLDVQLVVGTPGREGSGDNLEKLSRKECDGALAQSDAMGVYLAKHADAQLNYEVASQLYLEALHLVCNADVGLSKITGLTKNTRVLVGTASGGASTTWDSLVLSDPKRYGVVPTGTTALGPRSTSQVLSRVNDTACILYVAGLNAPSMTEVNAQAKQDPKLVLVPANDSDLLKLKDSKGKPIYTAFTIPGGTYGNLQHGTFSTAVDTVAVTAELIVSNDYIDANGPAYDNLLRAVNRALPAIRKRVGQ